MTELENKIKESGLSFWESHKDAILSKQYPTTYISMCFTTEGIFDTLIYDLKKKKVCRIDYPFINKKGKLIIKSISL